jgi:FAD/FMN-containing dehydrogenase/Fe-S oxidoreductase
MNGLAQSTELEHALRTAVSGEVRFDRLTRHLYSTDASHYRIVPLGVVLPRHADDIGAVMTLARQFGVPVLPRGGGTSLSGQTVGPAIILDTSRYLDAVLEVNPQERWVRVQPGVVLDQLNTTLRPHALMFGPDPASSAAATLGGMLGNNSTGTHSILYGLTADHTLELDVILADGSPITVGPDAPLPAPLNASLSAILHTYREEIETRYPKTWRTVAGYALDRLIRPDANPAHLFVGSEGTLGVIVSAKLGLVPRPIATGLAVVEFDSLRAALEAVPVMLETGPAAIELIDRWFLNVTRRVPAFARRLTFVEGDPHCLLVVEYFGEGQRELQAKLDVLMARLRAGGYHSPVHPQTSPEEIANVWAVRKAGFGLLMSLRGDAKPLAFMDDAAVPVARLAEYAEGVTRICTEAGTETAFFAHASAGCLHINPLINLKTTAGVAQMRAMAAQVVALAIRLGGTTTGEHGEGLARSCFNQHLFGPRLHQAFRQVKALFDPDRRLNPGKIVDAADMAEPGLLRFSPDYRTPLAPAKTVFDFSADGGFAGLVEMCNGQGMCRARGSGTMCPSFMATRDERHSVRGRANALRAAMMGELGLGGMTGPEVYDTLDLCLGCKACKSECASRVDMAKLKAEVLSQYYAAHGIPLRARVFGHIAQMNRLGRLARRPTNWALRSRRVRALMERWLGMDHRRTLPPLAPQSFEAWFRRRTLGSSPPGRRPEVILFHDTFMNENEPAIGQATVEVLEAAGYGVRMVSKVCCGRPLISKGLLADAKRHAAHNVTVLAPFAERGVPIIGCEPSCVAALRDEYPDLLPGDARARVVAAQTYFLDEWIVTQAEAGQFGVEFDPTPRRVLYHVHCHQRALSDAGTLARLFTLIPNCQAQSSHAGCCGMAGSFGYEVEHYDLSMSIGQDRLFPAIHGADMQTLIVAPGTSCRHQIYDGTGRHALHPAQVLRQALVKADP